MVKSKNSTGRKMNNKAKKNRKKSGLGVGNIVSKLPTFEEFVKEDHCSNCKKMFSFLTKINDDRYCMNCHTLRFGSEATMQFMIALDTEQQLSWEQPLDVLRTKDLFYSRKYADNVEDILLNFISSAVEVWAVNQGNKMCKEKTCSTNQHYFIEKDMREGLLECGIELIKKMRNGKDGLIVEDEEFGDYIQEKIIDQIEGLNTNGFNYLKYLITFYNHFKHSTIENSFVGNLETRKVFDFDKLEVVECPFDKNDIDDDTVNVISRLCKILLSNSGFYDQDDQELNQFNLDFEDESAENTPLKILLQFHEGTDHSKGLVGLHPEQTKFLKDNGYGLDWKGFEEKNYGLMFCTTCKTCYPIVQEELQELYDMMLDETEDEVEEPIEKTVEKIVEGLPSLDNEFLADDIKLQKKNEKIKKSKPQYVSLPECIRILAELKIYNQTKLLKAKKDKYAKNIPKNPKQFYKDGFTWTKVKTFKPSKKAKTYDRLEQALKQLKENWKFYERKPDGFFLVLFDDWGVWKATDPFHQRFFSEFINLRQTPEGRRELFEALSVGRFDMQVGHFVKSVPSVSSIKSLQFSNDVTETIDDLAFDKLLDATEHELGVNKILSETDDLIPMDRDSEAYKLHVRIIIQELWMAVLKNGFSEKDKILKLRRTVKSTMARHVISKFLGEYSLIKIMQDEIKESDYRGYEPNPMQLYGSWMVKAKCGYGNFSSTGTGKTDMAIISSRVTDSFNTLVVCPNTIKEQWGNMITKDYPLSDISISNKKGDAIFPKKDTSNKFKYHMINFQKFGREASADELLDEICKTRVDMVIIDEAQNAKQREEEQQSNTRENIEILLERLRERKPKLKVIFLTATPVINNLTEGVKLLEMIANKKFPHLKTANKIRNASRLYMEYLEYSLRFKIDYKINVSKVPITTQTHIPIHYGADKIRTFNYSDWEILCTPDRIPEMIKAVGKHGKAIIYTEFVSIVRSQIRNAFEKAINPNTGKPFRVGEFTGEDKEGLHKKTDQRGIYTNPFQNGDIDVLIASTPIAEGIDGLQKICNCIIFNGVTWTFAKKEQIVGRIVRTGQPKDNVFIYEISSRIENYDFDQRIKVDRLHAKEMLQLCVLDGQIPNIKAWEKGTKDYYHDFIECVIKDQASRIATKKQIKDSGVTELA